MDRTLQAQLRAHYDPLPFGILLLDRRGEAVYVNRAYRVVLQARERDARRSEAHHELLAEFKRRLQNRESYTLRLVPDEGDVIVLDLFRSDVTLRGFRFTLVSLVPVGDRSRLLETKERDEFIFDRMRVNLRSGLARYGSRLVPFSAMEFRLFGFLCRNADRVWHKHELLERVWGTSVRNTRTVDVHISRIRKKLRQVGCANEFIHTRFGQGYVFLLDWRP